MKKPGEHNATDDMRTILTQLTQNMIEVLRWGLAHGMRCATG